MLLLTNGSLIAIEFPQTFALLPSFAGHDAQKAEHLPCVRYNEKSPEEKEETVVARLADLTWFCSCSTPIIWFSILADELVHPHASSDGLHLRLVAYADHHR